MLLIGLEIFGGIHKNASIPSKGRSHYDFVLNSPFNWFLKYIHYDCIKI